MAQGAAPDAALQPDLAAGHAVLEEFLAADIVVLGAPMYNFTIPSQLKAWIDRIVVAGKTFKYGAQGPEGRAGNKRVIVAISRGGFYGPGTPAAVAPAQPMTADAEVHATSRMTTRGPIVFKGRLRASGGRRACSGGSGQQRTRHRRR